jgi:2-dehydro-3-deoxygluconokinase
VKGPLAIRPDGRWDFIALGGLVLRLDPGVVPFRKARAFDVHVSGGEFNVAANLADCFGLRTAVASAIVDNAVGDLVADRVRSMGVRAVYKHFAHDGVRGPNMAMTFSDRGFGVRPPVVLYNRANEAAATLKRGDFAWDEVFDGGVRWFHSGGIFAALSESTADLVVEGMEAARSAGAVVSYDLNYREKLWRFSGGQDRARSVNRRIVEHVDVLIGNEEDLQKGLGIPGPQSNEPTSIEADTYREMIGLVLREFPQLNVVATTLREVHSANRHTWNVVAWLDGETYTSPTGELDVFDRVGGGDGFSSGLFYGLLAGDPAQESVNLGWAHGALLATYPGDTTMASLEQVRELAHGGNARIQR